MHIDQYRVSMPGAGHGDGREPRGAVGALARITTMFPPEGGVTTAAR